MLDKKDVQRTVAIAAWAYLNSKKPFKFSDSHGNSRSLTINGGSSSIQYSDPLNYKLVDAELGAGRTIKVGDSSNQITMNSLNSSSGVAYCQASQPSEYRFTISGNKVTFDSGEWYEVS